MVKQRRTALVCAGPLSRGSLTRLSCLPDQVDCIKSSSIPTASRAVAALRAGRAVRSYEELTGADLFLISVPDYSTPRILDELAGCGIEWGGRTIALYDSEADSDILAPFAALGARTATLNWSPLPERFIMEGDSDAIRRLRTLTGSDPVLVLRSKASYLEGLRTATSEFFPLLADAVDHFRAAGLDKAAAEKTAALLFAESARTWLRAGRRLLNQTKRPASLPAR